MMYAFSENFVLPISHDEVVHGKGSLLQRMPGDDWQRFANLRAGLAMMWGHPGKKLLFMGCEFAQAREWNAEASLDWHLLDDPRHAGVQRLVRDLNRVLRHHPALHEQDYEPHAFAWIDANDAANSIYSFVRWGRDGRAVVVLANFTPVPREGYRLGLPSGGAWRELINTDLAIYGGSGVGNGEVQAEDVACSGQPRSALVNVPPLGVLMWVQA